MTGLEFVIVAGVAAVLALRSPGVRRVLGRGGRRAGGAAMSGTRAAASRIRDRRDSPAGTSTSRAAIHAGWSWLSGLVWARTPRPTPPPPAAAARPAPAAPAAGTVRIADGVTVEPAAGVFTRIRSITEHMEITVDEFRALNRAIRSVGEVDIDPRDPEAVEAFIGWLTGLRGSLIALGSAITEFAELADQRLRLDGRVTSPIYDAATDLTEAASLPHRAWQTLEQLYEAQLTAMRSEGEGVRAAAPELFSRQAS